MKWTWFNKDRPAVGFTLGILIMLVGIYGIVLYVNEAIGQPGAEILVFTGSIGIIGGLINNVYITICWRRRRTRRHIDTRD